MQLNWGFGKHLSAAVTILLLAIGLITFINSPDESGLAEWQIVNPQYSVLQAGADPEGIHRWSPISLPNDWYRQLQPDQSLAMRFTLPASVSPEPALALSYSARSFFVWLDNTIVHQPVFPEHLGRVFASAYLLPIEINKITQAQLVTVVIPATQSGTVSIGKLYFGPRSTLTAFVDRSNFVRHTLSALIVFTMSLSVLVVFGLWILRPLDTIYLWYSFAVVCWAIYSYGHLPPSLPFDVRVWDWIRLTALHFWPVLVVVFCNRFINRPQPFIELLLALYAAVTSLFALTLSRDNFFLFADAAWPLLSYVIGFYASWIMLNATFRQRAPNVIWMTLCGMLIMLLSLHDILVIAHWIDPWRGVVLHYSAALLVLVFTAILLQRFVAAFSAVEALNKELSGQVAQKTTEISRQLSALKRLEREKALAEERARLMRDMHDGIGGELSSLRAALEHRKLDDRNLRESLTAIHDDLYLMVQSLDSFGDDLGVALGQIRPRLESKVTAAGMSFVFNIAQLPLSLQTSSRLVLNVIRIIQEAITNSIRHASASCIELRVERTDDSLVFSIIDNGDGLRDSESNNLDGNGMRNMQERALRIGGTLRILSGNTGMRIVLSLPWDVMSRGLHDSRGDRAI